MPAPPITVFSDFTCPFCYVTEAALRRRAARAGGEIRYRAFELYPAPVAAAPPAEERGWDEPLRPLAEELGLALRAPDFRPRTRKAHEAARFAAAGGVEESMREVLFAAYWAEGLDIGRIDVLAELATRCGLDPTDLKIALDVDTHLEAVLRDQRVAEQLRITRLPTLFLGTGPQARILVGAQTPATLDEALESR